MTPRNNRYVGCFPLAGEQRRVWRSSGFCQGFPVWCQEKKNELMQLSERCRGLAGLDVGIGRLGVPIGHGPASLGNVHLVPWKKKQAGSWEQTASSAAGNSSEWIFGEEEKKNRTLAVNGGTQRWPKNIRLKLSGARESWNTPQICTHDEYGSKTVSFTLSNRVFSDLNVSIKNLRSTTCGLFNLMLILI